MDNKKIILLVVALFIAVGTAFMLRSVLQESPTKQASAKPVPKGPEVLVAVKSLPVGTIIGKEAFKFQPWPKELVEKAYYAKVKGKAPKMSELVGTVVRHNIAAGQPITRGSLVSPGDRGFLAAALGPGMRAVTIPVSSKTGVAGFVFPGDRVDLMLTQNVADSSVDARPLRVAETIVSNVRVLATDQKATTSVDEQGNTKVKKFKLVTIEVTPQLAEKVSVALSLGQISLSLRSLADNQAELEQALATGEANIPEGASPEEEAQILAKIEKQPTSGAKTYTTGGQVSRFHRQAYVPTPTTKSGQAKKEIKDAAFDASINQAKIKAQKSAEKAARGPIIRISDGGAVKEVELERR